MKNILFIGHFKDASGYANASRGYLRILDKYLNDNEYNLKIFPLNFEKRDFSEGLDKELITKYSLSSIELINYIEKNKYTVILCSLPNFCNIDTLEMPIKQCLKSTNCIKSFNLVFWETDRVPKPWNNIYSNKTYDELIVCCEWNKKNFEEQTSLKTNIVYPYVYDYFDLEHKIINSKFRIFSMSQWQHRKGFDILLRAYYQEFFNQDDVELFIKTYRAETSNGSDEISEKNIIINEIENYKRSCLDYGNLPKCKVLLKTGFCSKEEIKNLYQQADVFCLPTRGEGFGLTIAQSLLSGVPCIVPDIGGHIDFVDKDNSYLIKSSPEPVYNMPFHAYSCVDMNYIEPSLGSTRVQLRNAYNDWKNNNILQKARIAKLYAQNVLSEEKIFSSFLKCLL